MKAQRVMNGATVELANKTVEVSPPNAEEMCASTRSTLLLLASHWKDRHPELATAIDILVNDPEDFNINCVEWSQKAGLAFALPRGALQCQPIAHSIPQDGLRISTAGGPVRPTHQSLIVAPAPPCGFGVFASSKLKEGDQLGEYLGMARRYNVWVDEIKDQKRRARGSDSPVPFIPDELYSAWTGQGPMGCGVIIDAFRSGNAMRFVNCSCKPNCHFETFGEGAEGHGRLVVKALRDIEPWEQISVDYGWFFDPPTMEDVHTQAMVAYDQDLPALQHISKCWLKSGPKTAEGQNADSDDSATGAKSVASKASMLEVAGTSHAVSALCELLKHRCGLTSPLEVQQPKQPNYLNRFVDLERLTSFLEGIGFIREAQSIADIPEVARHLYEVVGATAVGIHCCCALDLTLNATSQCSGVIGRPIEVEYENVTESTT